MRQDATPHWLSEDGRYVGLQRVPFAGRDFTESFLQEALHLNPQLLPVDELDPSFGPLLSLGREIRSIDNVFISPNGWLTFVETKLWRNPEATREVVAQILDYASRLTRLGFTEFEAECRKALNPAPLANRSLYEYVSSELPDECPSEQEFVDSVSKALRTGRFLLLIVGDGIREGIEGMLGALHTHPDMRFTFGLVEMQVFRHQEAPSGKLIVPRIVANTSEILRATVRVETTGPANVSVELEPEDEKEPGRRRRRLSEEEFFEETPDKQVRELAERITEWADENSLITQWRASSVSIRLPDPRGSRQKFTLFVLKTRGELYTGWLHGQLKSSGYNPELAIDYVARLCALFPGIERGPKYPDTLSREVSPELVAEHLDDFLELVGDLVEEIRSARE